jgi:hypothetical protein
VPAIQAWIDEKGFPPGVDLYSVSTGAEPTADNYPPDAWLEREGWTVPIIADDAAGSVAAAFGLHAFPFFVAVGSDGTVLLRAAGEIPVDQLELLVEELAQY